MNGTEYCLRKDDDSHLYVFPADLIPRWEELEQEVAHEASLERDDLDHKLGEKLEEFEATFGVYRLGHSYTTLRFNTPSIYGILL